VRQARASDLPERCRVMRIETRTARRRRGGQQSRADGAPRATLRVPRHAQPRPVKREAGSRAATQQVPKPDKSATGVEPAQAAPTRSGGNPEGGPAEATGGGRAARASGDGGKEAKQRKGEEEQSATRRGPQTEERGAGKSQRRGIGARHQACAGGKTAQQGAKRRQQAKRRPRPRSQGQLSAAARQGSGANRRHGGSEQGQREVDRGRAGPGAERASVDGGGRVAVQEPGRPEREETGPEGAAGPARAPGQGAEGRRNDLQKSDPEWASGGAPTRGRPRMRRSNGAFAARREGRAESRRRARAPRPAREGREGRETARRKRGPPGGPGVARERGVSEAARRAERRAAAGAPSARGIAGGRRKAGPSIGAKHAARARARRATRRQAGAAGGGHAQKDGSRGRAEAGAGGRRQRPGTLAAKTGGRRDRGNRGRRRAKAASR